MKTATQVGVRDVVSITTSGVPRHADPAEQNLMEVHGWVNIVARERGKLVRAKCRSGHNVWTATGREFLALGMSYSAVGVKYRSDGIYYIGVGVGSQPAEPGVTALVSPVSFDGSAFLAAVDVPPTFPLYPTRTSVRYHITFDETQLLYGPDSGHPVAQNNISELGLFNYGSPARATDLASAPTQAPVAYKSFDPIGKTSALKFEIAWEVRF